MKKIVQRLLATSWRINWCDRLEETVRRFSRTERFLFRCFSALLIAGTVASLIRLNSLFLVEIPALGGTLVEGVVGTPRFVNPLLAISDTDRDLTALIYSGLLKATPTGELIPDLAASYDLSEDGLTYTFLLREGVRFHDGTPVTADDVIFTIQKAQDPTLKSPKRANWEGVAAEKVDEKTVRLILKQPYAPFLENATLGILPKHIWKNKNVESELFLFSAFSTQPIGSGPYQLSAIRWKNTRRGEVALYRLEPFRGYSLGIPLMKTLIFRFYQNQDTLLEAFQRGEVTSMHTIPPQTATELARAGIRVEHALLPRVFGVFFNQNQAPVFSHREVREALNRALDKERLVLQLFGKHGAVIDGPIPPGLLDVNTSGGQSTTTTSLEAAQNILKEKDWRWNEEKKVFEKKVKKDTIELRFSLSTSNTPDLKAAAEFMKTAWESLGARVDIKVFEIGDLNQNVIRPRKYDALFFGEIVGRDLDLFAFWHSSQRNDPGLNIALYTNAQVDKLLEEARTLYDRTERLKRYQSFEAEVKKETPAIFVYSPDFLYVLPEKVKGFSLGKVSVPHERFLNIHEWYIETEKVWPLFARGR